jgi:hypothetical protein
MTRRVMSVRNDEARPAFYARTGHPLGDLLALLHPPYTAWHISYVVYGASVAAEVDLLRLAGTMAAFFFGTGIAAHSLDEWHSRPLKTKLSRPCRESGHSDRGYIRHFTVGFCLGDSGYLPGSGLHARVASSPAHGFSLRTCLGWIPSARRSLGPDRAPYYRAAPYCHGSDPAQSCAAVPKQARTLRQAKHGERLSSCGDS